MESCNNKNNVGSAGGPVSWSNNNPVGWNWRLSAIDDFLSFVCRFYACRPVQHNRVCFWTV